MKKMDVRSYCSLKFFYYCDIDCQSCCDSYAAGTFRTDDGGCYINVLLYRDPFVVPVFLHYELSY